MDEELDIYEFEWWNVFAVFLVLLLISIGLIGISFLLVGKLIFLYCGYSSIGLCVSLFGLWFIKSVPKQIIFMKNSISIVPAIGVRKEYSYEEIAEHLNIPLGTVKAQLFRAREFLYQIIKKSEGKI